MVIRRSVAKPLALSDLESAGARLQEFRNMLAGAMETTFTTKYKMIGAAYFDPVALLMGKRSALIRPGRTGIVQDEHRRGDERWSLAFPIGVDRDTGKEVQLNSGYKQTIVTMHNKLVRGPARSNLWGAYAYASAIGRNRAQSNLWGAYAYASTPKSSPIGRLVALGPNETMCTHEA